MSNIERKIVSMEFNNKDFESGVQTSLTTLDKLKNSLKFDGATKGLDDISKASGNVSFDTMANSLDGVSHRFSAMGIIGMTILQDLTRSAIATGKKMANALIDPIVAGGKKRALNILRNELNVAEEMLQDAKNDNNREAKVALIRTRDKIKDMLDSLELKY